MKEIIINKRKRNSILILFLIGIFIGALDSGIIGPALQSIQGTFNIDERLSSWLYTIFILFFTIGSPVMAKLSDFKGRKYIYILCMVIFALGSGIIVIAPSFEFIILGRAVQGFAAGGIFPVAAAFIGDYFPLHKRGAALGYIGSMYGLGAICSPILGSLILPYGWEWLFLINIPIAIALISFSFFVIPDFGEIKEFNIDWKGILFFTIAISCLAYGINQIDSSRFIETVLSLKVLPFLLLFMILIPILLKIEKMSKEPLLPIHLFKNKEIRLASCISFSFGIIVSSYVFIPSLAILIFFNDYSTASLIMLPIVVTTSIAAPIIGNLLDRIGSKVIMISGSISLIMGLISVSFFLENFYIFVVSEILISYGLFTLVGAPLRYIVLSETKSGGRAAGQAAVNILSSVGQLIGGALVGAVIASFGGILFGYTATFLFLTIFAVTAFLLAIQLKNRKEQFETMRNNS